VAEVQFIERELDQELEREKAEKKDNDQQLHRAAKLCG
jgi:hypothetical protein